MVPSLWVAFLASLSLRLAIAQSFSCKSSELEVRFILWAESQYSRAIVSQQYHSSIK